MAFLDNYTSYVAGAVAALVVYGLVRRQNAQRVLPLPPGPKPLPLIGNALDLPKEKEWLTYRAWNDKYGDIVCVDVLGQKIVVLGSAAAANDLLEQRGGIYSDRPITPMLQLMKLDWSFAVLPYGDMWRRKRKLMHTHIHQGVAAQYHTTQLAFARRLVKDLLAGRTDNEALPHAVCLNFAQTILKAVYAIDVDSYEDEYVWIPGKVIEDFGAAGTPGRFLIDLIPLLKYVPAWMPGAGFKRMALQNRINQQRMLHNPLNVVKAQMAAGTAPPSMARTMLEDDAKQPPEKSQAHIIADVAGLVYLGGSDTTIAAVVAFFLAMLVYPDVQTRAQAEVDRVVGQDRLPEFADRKEMPYVEGVVNECLRWLPVVPMAVPHRVLQDDQYRGYFIPKGSIVLGPVWNILHNPADYPDPERFEPARYLGPDGQLDPAVRDPRTACFGFGRRICPGRALADAGLFITVATVLATVDVVRAKDEHGNELVPEVDVTSGLVSHPKPFPWAVRPRRPCLEEMLAAVPAA